MGYSEAVSAFARAACTDSESVIQEQIDAAAEWDAGTPPNDDMTFLALRVRGEGAQLILAKTEIAV